MTMEFAGQPITDYFVCGLEADVLHLGLEAHRVYALDDGTLPLKGQAHTMSQQTAQLSESGGARMNLKSVEELNTQMALEVRGEAKRELSAYEDEQEGLGLPFGPTAAAAKRPKTSPGSSSKLTKNESTRLEFEEQTEKIMTFMNKLSTPREISIQQINGCAKSIAAKLGVFTTQGMFDEVKCYY